MYENVLSRNDGFSNSFPVDKTGKKSLSADQGFPRWINLLK